MRWNFCIKYLDSEWTTVITRNNGFWKICNYDRLCYVKKKRWVFRKPQNRN